MATKTERSFIFYLKCIPVVCPSSELPILRFFFPFLFYLPAFQEHLLTPLVNQSLLTAQSGDEELVSGANDLYFEDANGRGSCTYLERS